ncbi:MAG: redox-active disulfide protein 2 [uncultured bacterium]|nr:MAG: redox-active disulfide protein 2 [uncultured bacterium]HCU70457.1 thioredoxin family protein [Candidatus Moranbacteria bacterium]
MKIKVLGSGCPSCKKLYEEAVKASNELDLNCEVEYITDIQAMLDLGIMSAPVLMIDEKIVCAGRMPDLEEIKKFLGGGELSKKSEEARSETCGCCYGHKS